MVEFKFKVSDITEAKKAIKKIDDKFNSNEQAKKLVYREIKQLDKELFFCEFVFPFPDLRGMAWFLLVLNLMIFFFYRHFWVFIVNILFFAIVYRLKYMTSSKYYFKMLVKGMKKNGYKGEIRRVL